MFPIIFLKNPQVKLHCQWSPALWQGEREEMLKDCIGTKVRSELDQAKYIAVTWGDETYL